MFRTQQSRRTLVWVLGVLSGTFLLFYFPVMELFFHQSLSDVDGVAFAVYALSMTLDFFACLALAFATFGAAIYFIDFIFRKAIPAWIKKGEEEDPRLREKMTANALRADNKRLMREAAEVPALKRRVAVLERTLALYQDPVESDGYVQPSFLAGQSLQTTD